MSNLTRRPIISISGDSHLPEGDIKIELAERLGRRLVDENYRILTGGREGIMEAPPGEPVHPGNTAAVISSVFFRTMARRDATSSWTSQLPREWVI